MTKIIYTNKTIKYADYEWNIKAKKKVKSVHLFRNVQHLGNSLNNNSKTHKNPHSKEQSKLRFKKQPTNYTTSDMKIKQQTLTIYKKQTKTRT